MKFHGILAGITVGSAADGGKNLVQRAAAAICEGSVHQLTVRRGGKRLPAESLKELPSQSDDAVAG